jgi:hypothetical protein
MRWIPLLLPAVIPADLNTAPFKDSEHWKNLKKKSLIPVKTGIQGLHTAQLDPLLSGKYLVPRNKDLLENLCGIRQVFWLTDLSTHHPFPTGSPGQWPAMAFVPVYSGGTATASHRLPF